MADGTVGVKQATTPDRLVDNEVLTVGPNTVYRQRVQDPEAIALLEEVKSAIQTGTSELTLRYDEGVTYTYIGEAAAGSSTGAGVWRIKRMTNSDVTILWANGSTTFTQIWNNRAGLSYS